MQQRLPIWSRRPLDTSPEYVRAEEILRRQRLHTVCRSAHCPNRTECWNRQAAAFMILGDECTRNCRFCAVKHSAHPPPVDPEEPARLVEAVRQLGLHYVVITSVTRDDLCDGGAGQFAACVTQLHGAFRTVEVEVEVLVPDFHGVENSLDTVLNAGPTVFNHNLETVKRLQKIVRPQADYQRSLTVLAYAAQRGAATKSGLMLGMGEADDEILDALHDLKQAGVERLTLGQYLAPSPAHHPISRFVPPDEFAAWQRRALDMGFQAVAAGPLVRSSYHADLLTASPARKAAL